MTDAIDTTIFENFTPPAPDRINDPSELGQDEFMQLMLTQLKYQDPFKPLENGEFIAQMAQFSTVAGIEGMNTSMETFIADQAAAQTMQAAELLGKTVITDGGQAVLADGGSVKGQFSLPEDSRNVTARYSNPSGEVVHTLEMGALGEGIHEVEWDGITRDGQAASAGSYVVNVQYLDSDGDTVTAETSLATEIESVNFGAANTRPTLSTSDGRELVISDIKKIL